MRKHRRQQIVQFRIMKSTNLPQDAETLFYSTDIDKISKNTSPS